jgi:hypothetical protein
MATAKKTTAKARAARKTPVRKAVAAKPAVPAKAAKAAGTAGKAAAKPAADKTRKPKLVRDSFTIPKAEYSVLEELKQRAAKLGRPTKKSEVLRAGIKALAAMSDAAFLAGVAAVPAVKTGRPAKS